MRIRGGQFVVEKSAPSTRHDSLLARLDRLAPVKEVAQIGAAIGREFSHVLLAITSARSGRADIEAEAVTIGRKALVTAQANESSGNAGTVTIDATGLVEVREGGQISSSTFAQGNAGKVTVTAERVLVDGDGSTNATIIGSQAELESSGGAGTVTIEVAGLVEVREGGQISSGTVAQGNAGTVTVTAGRVLIDAQDFGEGGSKDSTVIGAQAGDTDGGPRGESLGNAGRVTINAGPLWGHRARRLEVRNLLIAG